VNKHLSLASQLCSHSLVSAIAHAKEVTSALPVTSYSGYPLHPMDFTSGPYLSFESINDGGSVFFPSESDA
jgi:hypothetical protein